jgi:hypothetical protein
MHSFYFVIRLIFKRKQDDNPKKPMKKPILALATLGLLTFSCDTTKPQLTQEQYDALTDEQKRSVEFALDGIEVLDDRLQLTLFASEPMLTNPTNMDIDDRGRVWITEAYNYRIQLNPNQSRRRPNPDP